MARIGPEQLRKLALERKAREHSEAYQAALRLGEKWQLEAREAPDFLVRSGKQHFGLEVTHCHIGPKGRKGAAARAEESARHRWLTEIREDYEAAGGASLHLRYSGEVSPEAAQTLLRALREADLETRRPLQPSERLDLPKARVYVHTTPNTYWMMVEDRVGSVSQDSSYLQREIDHKASKLPAYRKIIGDVRLLVVADRIYNSGKLQLPEDFRPDLRGFDAVYFFSYPASVSSFFAAD